VEFVKHNEVHLLKTPTGSWPHISHFYKIEIIMSLSNVENEPVTITVLRMTDAKKHVVSIKRCFLVYALLSLACGWARRCVITAKLKYTINW